MVSLPSPALRACDQERAAGHGGTVYGIERAVRRAALLAQTGIRTRPVMAGQRITADAAELARAMRVWQVLDGQGKVADSLCHGRQGIAPEAVGRTDGCGDARQGTSASPPVADACQPVFPHAPHGWLPAQPAGGHQDVAS